MPQIVLPWLPDANLSPNARVHWSRLANAKRRLREDTCYEASAQCRQRYQRAVVTVQVRLKDPGKRRDLDNYMARMKALFDGLVDAGLVPDDSHKHLRVQWAEPPFIKGSDAVILTIQGDDR